MGSRYALIAPLVGLLQVGQCAPLAAQSTVVRFETSLGDIDVRLFDTATPESVENFLNYVTDGDYDDSFIHRAPPGFVIQGGGFRWPEGANGFSNVPTDAPVVNEPVLTNLRGTLAYAKLGGDPNSATSGWFFSLGDNSANLDNQNGGFTVFGTVVGDGLQTVDAIGDLDIVNAGGAFTTLPLLDSFQPPTIFRDDLVFIDTIRVVDFAAGDYDFDGDVDFADRSVWASQFGASLRLEDHAGASPAITLDADGNGDGVVDAADFTVWRDAFGASTAVGVPEPSAGLLALLALPFVARRR